LLYPPIENYF